MKLARMSSLLICAVAVGHLFIMSAKAATNMETGDAGSAAASTETIGTSPEGEENTGQSKAQTHNRVFIKEAPANALIWSSATKSLTLIMPPGTKTETLKVVLNGKDVTARFTPSSCTGAVCETGTLSDEDGLRPGKNVLYAISKGEDGKTASSRLRFAGRDTQPSARSVFSSSDLSSQAAGEQTESTQPLPTANSFLPPTINLSTLYDGGGHPGKVWLQLGTQTQLSAAPGCGAYSVIVLDRQTLVEKTSAPESSPSCQPNGAALAAYLKGLSASDLVIVGTVSGYNSDAGDVSELLDTSAIGGSAYNCDPTKPLAGGCLTTLARSKDIPQSYIAIGAGGAAPGSAYENYQTGNENPSPSSSYFYSNAYGMLTEDANGNYNFQSSSVVEYVVSPGIVPAGASVTLNNTPYHLRTKVLYRPPTGTKWVLGTDVESRQPQSLWGKRWYL